MHVYRSDGKRETIDSVLKGAERIVWAKILSNEWGRLANGNK